jgi:hypothetical protein
MTIRDLIGKLQTFDPNLPVMVDGYEGGVDTPGDIYQAPIILNVNDKWYYGKHEILTKPFSYDDAVSNAVIISRSTSLS